MSYATTDDGVKLYYEEAGNGFPMIFVHEFAGDYRSWEPQMRHFARNYRCITYSARGYAPSDIPDDVASYSQNRAADDIATVLSHLGIEKAHVIGLSMGGFATLHFGFRHPSRARSLVVAGCGHGAAPERLDAFRHECEATATRLEKEGIKAFAEKYALVATRVQHRDKDPRSWREFTAQLAEHSVRGSVNTLRGVQMARPSLYDLTESMKKLTIPTLIVMGDEDDPCLEPGILMKRTIPSAGLVVFPKTGHTINIEEAERFNRTLADFFQAVEHGRWRARDPDAMTSGTFGQR